MGYRHDSKRTQRHGKTTSVARVDEASRITAHERTVSMSKPRPFAAVRHPDDVGIDVDTAHSINLQLG